MKRTRINKPFCGVEALLLSAFSPSLPFVPGLCSAGPLACVLASVPLLAVVVVVVVVVAVVVDGAGVEVGAGLQRSEHSLSLEKRSPVCFASTCGA
jgi:hypothetical protein